MKKVLLTEGLNRRERRAVEQHADKVGGMRGEQFRALADDPKGRGWLRVEGYTKAPAQRQKPVPVNTLRMNRRVRRGQRG